MGWLILDAALVAAGFFLHMFWASTIRPWLRNETHVIISGTEAQASNIVNALKRKL